MRDARRVGELDEEHAVARQLRDAGRIVADRERVEAVERQAERRVIRGLHDAPRVRPTVDVPAPGERLVADPQASGGGALGHRAQVGRGARIIVDGGGLHVAAHQHQIGAECGHRVELAFRAIEVARALRVGHRLEVAEGLEQRDGEAEVVRHPAHVRG